MLLWLRGRSQQSRHSPAVSAECKLRGVLPKVIRHYSRRLQSGKAAPSPSRYPVAAAQAPDNSYTAAYYTPPKPRFVDCEAVRQSIRAREDAYPDAQDCTNLPPRGVLLFL